MYIKNTLHSRDEGRGGCSNRGLKSWQKSKLEIYPLQSAPSISQITWHPNIVTSVGDKVSTGRLKPSLLNCTIASLKSFWKSKAAVEHKSSNAVTIAVVASTPVVLGAISLLLAYPDVYDAYIWTQVYVHGIIYLWVQNHCCLCVCIINTRFRHQLLCVHGCDSFRHL